MSLIQRCTLLCAILAIPASSRADEQLPEQGRDGPPLICQATSDSFALEVWAKVAERTCLKCHRANGDAFDSEFQLLPVKGDSAVRAQAMRANREAMKTFAARRVEGQSVLLQKVQGSLEHGGGVVVKPDSAEMRILQRFVRTASETPREVPFENDSTLFFADVQMLTPRRLLRRVTLSLSGRLPTADEVAAVEERGDDALDEILAGVMTEDAFYDRLKEGFNDILLTHGYDGGGEEALSYEHFKTRLWYQDRNPNKNRPKDQRLAYSTPEMIAYTKLVRDYREAMRREPLELIAYIVRNDRPFSEIVTADYTMLSPYTSRGYGEFERLKNEFHDTNDPFEFIPAKINALQTRGGVKQESPTGFYPHAGLLSSFQYLKRYPTTETNRNRLRVRMIFEHFLGIDIMQLAPRVNDAAAITAKYEVPTMQAADCVVCHKVIDPIAGLYQDYYVVDGKGVYGARKEGWFADMFPAGWERESLPADQRWRSLQWLGQRTASDPRFATAMVGHVWYILSGRRPLNPPEDIDDPMFAARHRAWRAQKNEVDRIAAKFVESDFNLKTVFREWIRSDFYQVDHLQTDDVDQHRLAELDDAGLVRMLTPEQLERKLAAIFGKKWGRLTNSESKLNILYGGIDSKEVTERLADPSGAMGAIQRIMANEIACNNVAPDFSLPAKDRRLFPHIEPELAPGVSEAGDATIRKSIVHLHALVLGRHDAVDDPEVQRTFELFAGIVADAKSRNGVEKTESYFCQTERDKSPRDPDPHYTIRAWRAVVTYLLRQHEFLYE